MYRTLYEEYRDPLAVPVMKSLELRHMTLFNNGITLNTTLLRRPHNIMAFMPNLLPSCNIVLNNTLSICSSNNTDLGQVVWSVNVRPNIRTKVLGSLNH